MLRLRKLEDRPLRRLIRADTTELDLLQLAEELLREIEFLNKRIISCLKLIKASEAKIVGETVCFSFAFAAIL